METIPPGEKVVCNGVNFEWYINVYSNPARNNYSEYAELDSFLKEPPDPGQVYFGIVNEKRDYLEERLAQAGIRYRILRKNYFTTNNYPNSYAFYRLDIL